MTLIPGVPDSMVALMPMSPAPSGLTSNFIDPPSLGPTFMIVGGVLLGLMLCFVSVRLFCKIRLSPATTWDDLTCVVSAVGTIIYYIDLCLSIEKAHFGRHQWDTPLSDALSPWFGWTVWLENWLSTVVLATTKATFFLFYLQIFRPVKYLRIANYVGLTITILSMTAFMVAQLVYLTPAPGMSWFEQQTSSHATAAIKLSYPVASVSLAMDVLIFVIPIIGVSNLKLSTRRKFGVILVFLTGLCACIASSLSIYYRSLLENNQSLGDTTWQVMPVIICLFTEMCVGLICSCMPACAKCFGHYFPNFSPIDSMLSFNPFTLRSSRRTLISGEKSGSFGRRAGHSNKPSQGGNDPAHPWKRVHDVELGSLGTTGTMDTMGTVPTMGASKAVVVVNKDGSTTRNTEGIHLQQEWKQTWHAA